MKWTKRVVTLIMFLFVAGCSFGSDRHKDDERVTLNFFLNVGRSSNDSKNALIERLQAKFPEYNLRFISPVGSFENGNRNRNFEAVIRDGVFPDLLLDEAHIVPQYVQSGLTMDHTQLARSAGLDLGTIETALLETTRAYSESGQLYGIPYRTELYGLIYDKERFNRAGVPYPRKGMTWRELIALSRAFNTGKGEGLAVDWLGLESRYDLHYVDSRTGEPMPDEGNWRQALNLWSDVLEIPGNSNNISKDFALFQPAMYAGRMEARPSLMTNWDLLPYPADDSDETPKVNHLKWVLAVSPTSNHKNEAMRIIAYMLSEPFQAENARNGEATVLRNKDIQASYGANLPGFSGKNVAALYAASYQQPKQPLSKYDLSWRFSSAYALWPMGDIFTEYALWPMRNINLYTFAQGGMTIDQTIQSLKNDTASNTTSVKPVFEESAERVAKEMKRNQER